MGIHRRDFLKIGLAGAVATELDVSHSRAQAGAADSGINGRFNVIHILADQHQAAQTGYEGNHQVITPNLDRLAAQGMRFRRTYTQAPICTPSRVSMLSGQYCHNHGYYGLCGPAPDYDLPSYLLHFRQHGYRTAAIGKLHTPNYPKNWLDGHCDVFEEAYSYGPGGTRGGLSIEYSGYLANLGLLQKEDSYHFPEFAGRHRPHGPTNLDARPSNLPYEHCVEGWIAQRAIRFLQAVGNHPFCMQVSFPRPHQTLTPDKRFWNMYSADLALPATLHADDSQRPPVFQADVERRRRGNWLFEPKTYEAGSRRVWRGYLGCITQVDYAVGQLVDYLKKSGKFENTIIIYGSDHGGYMGTYGAPEKVPGICSEAVCRVPSVWHVPGVTPSGSVCHELVENVDIAPTITSLCGLPPMQTADGKDLSGLLRGGTQPVREAALTEFAWSKALRWGPWEFVHFQREMFGGKDVGELYNLEKDPNESHNLYHDPAHQEIVHECRRRVLESMIYTTRFVTTLPPPRWVNGKYWSDIAADGKESNEVGIMERIRRGALNYI